MTNDSSKGDRLAVTLLLGFFSLVGCVLEAPPPVAEDPAAIKDGTLPRDGGTPLPKEEPKGESGGDAGSTVPAAEACTTSFAKNVLPAFDAAGCAATQCHGTRFGAAVRIEVKDADLTYEQLTHLQLDGKPYVKTGTKDIDASAIHCHLAGKCGVKMPPLGGAVPPALVAAVDRWLVCGAPKN